MAKMFKMTQHILQKVSFDRKLFAKELQKAMRWLKPSERVLLYTWCLANFEMYRDVILEVFRTTVSKG